MGKTDNTEKITKNSKPKHTAQKKKKGSIGAVICVVCIIIAILIGISVYANSYSKIYPNTYVADTKVSNMSPKELSSYLSSTYSADKIKGKDINLSCDTNSQILKIDELNVSYDNAALYNEVTSSGRAGNYLTNTFDFIARLVKPEVIDPVIAYNAEVLSSTINRLTEELEIEPVGHTFTIGDNKVTINGPVDGIKADREKAVNEVEKQIKSMTFSDIDLPLETVSADPLDFDVFYNWLTSDAENAYYEKIDGTIKVHPSKAKVEVDRSAVKNAIDSLKSIDSNMIEIPATTTYPEKTTQQLSDTLYSQTLGTYSTGFGGSTAARASNVRLAASRIDGMELMPDEEFSYDKTILPRTYENGYMAAPVYVGNKVESGLGGGICQPSSTLYVAALYANLEILERHNHSLMVSYMPPGLDATIAEGYLDLRFKNSTGYPIKIVANSDGGVITFSILGYNPDNIKVEIARSASGGKYHVTRVVYQNGTEIKREAMTSSAYGTPEKDEEPKKPEEKKEEKKEETPSEPQTEAPAATTETTPAPAPAPAPATPSAPAPAPAPAPSAQPELME